MSDHITITLDRSDDVIDLVDFAAMFAGLGSQFDNYMKERHPEIHGHARMGIRQMKEGSIIAELAAVVVPQAIAAMDAAVIMRDFMALIKNRYATLSNGRYLEGAKKQDLKDIADSVAAIAKDANAKATYEHREYDETGNLKNEERFSLETVSAKKISEIAEFQRTELDKTEGVDHLRVSMVFTRADVGDANLDRRSNEYVLIEEINPGSLPLIYQSELAERRIKTEIRGAGNVFRKGFVVNVNVRRRYGKPIAYAVVDVQNVFDLPKDIYDDAT